MIRSLIKSIRKQMNMNQEELAKIIGIAQVNYSLFETGKSNLSNENMLKLEKFINDNYELTFNGSYYIIIKKEK